MYRVNAPSRRQGEITSVIEYSMSNGITETEGKVGPEGFYPNPSHHREYYSCLRNVRMRVSPRRAPAHHCYASTQGRTIRRAGGSVSDTASGASHSTRLIILHLSTLNQFRLPLNLLKLDDGPLFRSEPFHLRFQIREEVALRPNQRSEEMFVVVKPPVLSR